jgi:membrane fusion protein, multidrug efflux system
VKHARLFFFIPALSMLFLLAACSQEKPAPAAASAPPISVKTEVVHAVEMGDTFQAPGTVRARTSAVISARVPGYVQDLKVKAGDTVRAGQTLVVLQSQDLDAQVARAKAAQQAAGSGITEAEKARAAAESNAQLAATTLQRYKTLLDKKSVSQQEFDEVEARYKGAAANLEMANAAIQRVRAGEQQAQAEVKAAEVMRGYSVLAAPFSGVVTEKRVEPGSLAMPGQPLLVLEQGGDFRLEATVEEARIAAIKLGDPVRVSIESMSEIQGRVSEMVPAVDAASRAFLVKIDLPHPKSPADARLLRSGLFGRATFAHGSRKAIAVPENNVRSYGQLTSVYVVADGLARQRLVTLGARSGDQVEILSGLSEGDRLVVSPPPALRDGSRVEEVRQ